MVEHRNSMAEKPIFDMAPDQLDRLLSIGEDVGAERSSEGPAPPGGEAYAGSDDDPDPPGEQPPPGATVSLTTVLERPGGWIGRYRLLGILGEGGMGMVYLAEQEQPIKREVALKVIKPGMDSARMIARFEVERQALALLDHPNIAHVFEAGTTDRGRPYLVMERVHGLPITQHCDRHKLSIDGRLRLFQQVCDGVQHAHQKGIVHRDIKPSNILVSAEGRRAIPKIIDFGTAKVRTELLAERTQATEDSPWLGTPAYMSPEQADMATEDIDTRSDVYSLGVVLYVLLTGVLPFDARALRESGIEHLRKTIRETDPKTPSTRLARLGQEAEKVAKKRRTEVATLAGRLHKELEWIPLKAMRKERAERYRSAAALADDVENYLEGAPLIAGPPRAASRLRKFVRWDKALAVGAVAVLGVFQRSPLSLATGRSACGPGPLRRGRRVIPLDAGETPPAAGRSGRRDPGRHGWSCRAARGSRPLRPSRTAAADGRRLGQWEPRRERIARSLSFPRSS